MIEMGKELLAYFLQGRNLVIATIALAFIAGYALWVFLTKTEQKKVKRIVWFSFIVAPIAGVAMFVNYRLEIAAKTFQKNQTGVLVLRIAGDDSNSLQRDLVDSLYSELAKKHLTNILVRASDQQLDDSILGLSIAHERARKIGKRFNAQLVVWGNRAGERKFWPRVTIVNQTNSSVLIGERELDVQEIDQLELPLELIDEPIYLATFIAGLSSYESDHYDEALEYFDSASTFIKTNSADIAGLQFYSGSCRLMLAETQNNPKALLLAAIAEFHLAANGFTKTNSPEIWAASQDGLGSALWLQANYTEGAEAASLLADGVAAYRAALKVRTHNQMPRQWAATQINLGCALCLQAQWDQINAALHLANGVSHFRVAQDILNRDQFPQDWAETQLNLGQALCEQARLSQGAQAEHLLADSVTDCRVALEVLRREQFPRDWAGAQLILGNVLATQAQHSQGAKATRLLAESVTAYRAALEVFTREKFPQDWARTQNNLGMSLYTQAQQSQGAEATHLWAESVGAYRAALEVQTRPDLNLAVSNNLARAEQALHQLKQ
jgi:tetratricopeptide (TPR) repeat protein